PDVKAILNEWDDLQSTSDNFNRIRDENVLGKSSRLRIEEILTIFKQRYLVDASVFNSLVIMAQNGLRGQSLDRILYFNATQSDPLLHDVVTKIIYSLYQDGRVDIFTNEVCNKIYEWVKKGRTSKPWSYPTTQRVTRGILSTLRDFGVLQGEVKKRISPKYLPSDAFAFIAFQLYKKGLSGEQILSSHEWKLFLLASTGVERFFIEAHQEDYLQYHAAGSVVRIEFLYEKIEEYAKYVVKRQN
ncbi:unnamed protein product, partial [marine sediment metagenome]